MKTGTKNNSTNSLRGKMPPDMAAIIPVIIIILLLLLRSEPDPTSGHNIDSGFLLHWLFYAVDTEEDIKLLMENWTEGDEILNTPKKMKSINLNAGSIIICIHILKWILCWVVPSPLFVAGYVSNYNNNNKTITTMFFFSGIQKIILNI